MKTRDICNAVGILSGMKLYRIPDKSTRRVLLDDYRNLRPLFKKATEEATEIRTKFQQDWDDELDAVQAFRDKRRPVVGHDAYLEAEDDANKAIADIYAVDAEVDIKAVSMDDFLANCGGEDLTLEQVAFLEEVGIIA